MCDVTGAGGSSIISWAEGVITFASEWGDRQRTVATMCCWSRALARGCGASAAGVLSVVSLSRAARRRLARPAGVHPGPPQEQQYTDLQ